MGSFSINTNVAALTAQRHFGINNFNLNTTLERLSSGYKVNRAADDAAGMAIGTKMETQIQGTSMALRNAQNTMNYIHTAESGIDGVANMVNRIRELVIQAANDTNVQSDRDKIQVEIDSLLQEIDRFPTSVNFNEDQPLQITQERLEQLDPPKGGPADISYIIDTSASMSGPIANVQAELGNFVANLTASNIDFRISVSRINRNQGGGGAGGDNVTTILDSSNNVATIQSAINSLSTQGSAIDPLNALLEVAGATRTAAEAAVLGGVAGDSYDTGADDAITRRSGVGYFQILVADTDPEAFHGDLTLDVPGGAAYPGGNDDPARFADTATILQRHGVTTYVVSDAGSAPDYSALAVGSGGVAFNTITGNFSNDLQTIANGIVASVNNPEDFVIDKNAIQIMVGANEGQLIGLDRFHINHTRLGLKSINVNNPINTSANYDSMISQADDALENLSVVRARYGAIENRIENTISTLMIANENMSASRSRIMDTDFADATANLTRNQILSQASSAILSQANLLPQNMLSLI